jgi:hypothetical protein
LAPLRRCGLINYPDDLNAGQIGQTDFVLTPIDNADVTCMVVEAKSTHSLPLPILATDVVRVHNGLRPQGVRAQWVRKPIGQLLHYMLQNGVRIGALTSSTRTYFLRIEDVGRAVAGRVSVSDAFFIGEENYLRAWVYCYSLTTIQRYDSKDVAWAAAKFVLVADDDEDNNGPTTRSMTQSRKRSYEGIKTKQKGSKKRQTGRSIIASSVIPSVPFGSLSFGKSLGYGRNGCVLRADWQGQSVAVKQFDLGRPGVFARFRKEIAAYKKLKLAQGVLVPKALFLSQRMGMAFLGLELGRDPAEGDDVSSWPQILKRLRTEYGFCHGDADFHNNCIFIKDNEGRERLVAMDLEEYELVGNGKRSP